MKTRALASLIVLFSLFVMAGATSAATVNSKVVIVQCGVSGADINTTASSESRNVRTVPIGASCARELSIYLANKFVIKSVLGDSGAQALTYTLVGP